MALDPGARLGPYEIIAQIGVGGMGEVYCATDTNLKRQVAIKVLPASVSGDVERLARFQREAEVLAQLNHPNIAQIYGLEKDGGHTALVMELVEGLTLADRIAQGHVPVDEVLAIAKQIAEALEAAHDQGIVHRDLKPANVKVRPDGTVKVLDFGLAKVGQPAVASSPHLSQPTITALADTQAGTILGTAAYMSPEQVRGAAVTARADIWAFGCVLYEMLTGQPGFGAATVSDTIARVLEREPDWRRLPGFTPRSLRNLLQSCLQKDPIRRPERMRDVSLALEKTGRGVPRVAGLVFKAAAVAALAIGVGVAGREYLLPPGSHATHQPVSVLIADFQNDTGDPTFDRTFGPIVRIALEGSSFITAYDRTQVRQIFGMPIPDALEEPAALELAARSGVSVVLSGALSLDRGDYVVSMRAVQASTRDTVASARASFADRARVFAETIALVSDVRRALGDDSSDTALRLSTESLMTMSLDLVRDFTNGTNYLAAGQYERALESFSKAVARDSTLGRAYAGMAIASRNLGRQQDADRYMEAALAHIDRMTERERLSTRGSYYALRGDARKCVEEYGALIERFPADASAHNNLAYCRTQRRDMAGALDSVRQAVSIIPGRLIYRWNMSLYASYGGDFQAGEEAARVLRDAYPASPLGLSALALAQTGLGRLAEASATYRELERLGGVSISDARSGLADLAMYEGRFADAIRMLEQSADEDLSNGDADRAAAKLMALAYARLSLRQAETAVAVVDRALASADSVKIQFLAARIFVAAGRHARAQALGENLSSRLQDESRAYGKLIEGGIALAGGDARVAITAFSQARDLVDTWIGRFDLGRAYLEAGAFVEADSEFDLCLRRRGEALALFLDESPTYGHLPPVHYFLGRAREGLKADSATSYSSYIAIRGQAGEDPLLAELGHQPPE